MEKNGGFLSYLGGGVEDRKRVESKLSFLFVKPSPTGLGTKGFRSKKPNVENLLNNINIFVFFCHFVLTVIHLLIFVRLTLSLWLHQTPA